MAVISAEAGPAPAQQDHAAVPRATHASATDHAARASARRPKVLCWNKDYPPPTGRGKPKIKRKPRLCTFMKRGEASNANAVRGYRLRWKKWGRRKARAKGRSVAGMGVGSDLRVTLRKPVKGCGGRIYSKAKFKSRRFDTKTKMRLWTTCRRPA